MLWEVIKSFDYDIARNVVSSFKLRGSEFIEYYDNCLCCHLLKNVCSMVAEMGHKCLRSCSFMFV